MNSMENYGQISPIVVAKDQDNKFLIIDGYKRFKAALKSKLFTHLKARLLSVSEVAIKVAIVQLNSASKTVSVFEESLVLSSLFHDDKLTQIEIAKLFKKNKSWVSRRISIVDRLCNEVQEQLKLELVSPKVL